MNTKRIPSRFFQAIAAGAAGMMLAVSCSPREVQAFISGIEAAARILDDRNDDDDISFGDWLASELD